MARKSRKNIVEDKHMTQTTERVYKAALYARISVENERKRESDSIGNQIQLLKDYVSEQTDLKIKFI